MTKRNEKSGMYEKIHGMKNTRLYRVWCSMKERCNNPHNKSYKNYGARGIKVCNEWSVDFLSFHNWAMKNGYNENAKYGECTIDRIDIDFDYTPNNCRFVSLKEQNRNYSKNHIITYNGETMCFSDMADKYGVKRATALFRLKNNKPLDVVFSRKDFRYAG